MRRLDEPYGEVQMGFPMILCTRKRPLSNGGPARRVDRATAADRLRRRAVFVMARFRGDRR